jgi:hypothetical protein
MLFHSSWKRREGRDAFPFILFNAGNYQGRLFYVGATVVGLSVTELTR